MTHALGMISEAVGTATVDALERASLGDFRHMGQIEEYLRGAIMGFFDRYGAEIGQRFYALAEPAARKAIEVARPAFEEALARHVPVFGGIAGGAIGLSLILGVVIARHVWRQERGRRR